MGRFGFIVKDEKEEVNLCMMVDFFGHMLDEYDEEVDLNDLYPVIEAYNELMSNFSKLLKTFQNLRK